jgi:transposase
MYGRVDVWAQHPRRTRIACPQCERGPAVYDHSEERAWRHLDSCGFLTYLHADPPRVDCPEHGVRQVRLPWAEPNSRFTMLFERLAIDVLKECDVTFVTCMSIGVGSAWFTALLTSSTEALIRLRNPGSSASIMS